MRRIIITGGAITTPDGIAIGDLTIEGEKLLSVGGDADIREGDEVIDAKGMFVLPGVIDAHTHIQLDTGNYKTPDDWERGTQTAAAGGVTTVIDFATQFPGQSFGEAVAQRQEEAESASVDYALHCMVTDLPRGKEDRLAELIELGVPSFKVYTTYRPNYYVDDATLLRIMRGTRTVGGLLMVHAENDSIVTEMTETLVAAGKTEWRYHGQARPALAEQEAIHRTLFLASKVDAPVYIVHCSTGTSVRLVREAARRGQPAWCETCPQYLLLNDEAYQGPNPERYILQPPLRAPENNEMLWQYVTECAVSVIATDSCDFTLDQKLAQCDFTKTPGGLPGIETLLPLIYTYGVDAGRIALEDMVYMLCENPARLFGLYPRKGTLIPGRDADVVVYDPTPEGQIHAADLHYLAGYTPYEGMHVQGKVLMTISRGEIIYRDGEITGKPGRGRFVPGEPFASERVAV